MIMARMYLETMIKRTNKVSKHSKILKIYKYILSSTKKFNASNKLQLLFLHDQYTRRCRKDIAISSSYVVHS